MRKLHLVGYTPDLEGLIFTARRGSKSGGYIVAIEDALVDTIDEARRRRNGDADPVAEEPSPSSAASGARANRPESTLTPREIQARLRSGRSIAQVATEARVDPDWVERFAVPILAEQAQIVELARASTYSKPRLGPSAQPLGASVAWNLAERGVQIPDDVLSAAWTAHQVHDTLWRVRLVYRSRGRAQEATWELDVATAQLLARNRLASELAHVEKGRRRRAVSRLRAGANTGAEARGGEETQASEPSRRLPARRAKRPARGAKRPAPRKAPARKAPARKDPARKDPARKAPAAKASTRKALAKPRTATRAKASPARPAKTTARKTTARKTAPRKGTNKGSATKTGRRAMKAVEAPRTAINRLAATKVAASRTAASRLAGDRSVGNTVTPDPSSRGTEARWSPPTARRAPTPAPEPKPQKNVINVEYQLDDMPSPPPPPKPARGPNRRTGRPAGPLFGVRSSPAPAG